MEDFIFTLSKCRLTHVLQPESITRFAFRQSHKVQAACATNNMLCDLCQEREATVHTMRCTNIAGDVPKQQHLCDECFDASNPTQARELTRAFQAGCRYCGGEPYGGGGDPLAMLSGTHKMSFMCKPCTEEYFRFLRLRMPGFGSYTITKEQVAKIKTYDIPAIFTEAEEHMKKWVVDRGSQ